MRKKYLAFLLAGCMTAGVPSMAWAAEQTTEAVSEETSGGRFFPLLNNFIYLFFSHNSI